ncbi:hypothetical protein XELAEV_18000688mg [Xenopus laevis]|uniref:Uncharacterized protein n=1 Tax=Xenopus laevis TaxID=8355 RepID=A0A974BQ58_XENLA|nr:hypothetical protein XELAEV_18000688mg [Xenopus laevis]
MDLSPATLVKRKAFTDITKLLRHNDIPYRWGYPVKLIIQRNGTPTTLSTVSDARKALEGWGLTPATDPGSPTWKPSSPQPPRKLQQD